MAAQRIQRHPLFVRARGIAIYYNDRLDRELGQWPVLTTFEQCTGIPKTYAVLGGTVLLIFLHCFDAFAAPVSNLVGWAGPAYLSFKAIETPSPHDDAQWLTYWTVFSFFNFIESFALRGVLHYEPWYFAYKSLFIVWLWFPASRGALGVYFTIIQPVLAIVSSLSNAAAATETTGHTE